MAQTQGTGVGEIASVEQATAMIRAALASPLPRFYVNTFINAASDSDILMILQCNNQNVGILNLSYVTAKTLAKGLSELIVSYEERHKLTVPVMEQATEPGTL